MYQARFGIAYGKRDMRIARVYTRLQFIVQFQNIILKRMFKFLNIRFFSLATTKFTPRAKKIFYAYDMPITPPPQETITLVHTIGELYKAIYRIGKTLSKRDHFGIHMKMENLSLAMLETAVNAQFSPTNGKIPFLQKLRTAAEVEKHLIRIAWDSHILLEKDYADLAVMLVTISKMTTGWIKYANGGH